MGSDPGHPGTAAASEYPWPPMSPMSLMSLMSPPARLLHELCGCRYARNGAGSGCARGPYPAVDGSAGGDGDVGTAALARCRRRGAIAVVWLAVALLGLAVFVWAHPVWWVVAGAPLVLGAVLLRPRPLRLAESPGIDDPRAAVQSSALTAALGVLAAELATRPPDVVFVTISADIALVRDTFGRRRVLFVGMPLWALLDDDARRAALVHELGHERYRDPRRVGLASIAGRWLVQWSAQVGPGVRSDRPDHPAHELAMIDPLAAQQVLGEDWRLRGVQRSGNLIAALVLALVQAAARVLERLTFLPHQRAELLADAAAIRVAGSDGVRRLLTVAPLRRRAGISARQALLRKDGVDLTRTVVTHLQEMPDDQREALARAVADEEVRIDQPHLPVRLRRELVDRLPTAAGRPVLDDTTWRVACDDLASAFAPLERELRRQAQQAQRAPGRRRRRAGDR
jgi:Zn-dependent protease with chaperone function